MAKIQFELSAQPSKAQKAAKGQFVDRPSSACGKIELKVPCKAV
jgi:hypothetical protein